jgi:hypothetical protein
LDFEPPKYRYNWGYQAESELDGALGCFCLECCLDICKYILYHRSSDLQKANLCSINDHHISNRIISALTTSYSTDMPSMASPSRDFALIF